MWRLALLALLAACAPEAKAAPDAGGGWCSVCDRATEYCVLPQTIAFAPSSDPCTPFPDGCTACDCVVASLSASACAGESPLCQRLGDGLVEISCPGSGP